MLRRPRSDPWRRGRELRRRRHTHAARLIGQSVHPTVIQERLGHASIRTTPDTYGHLFDGLDEAAAEALDMAWREPPADSSRTLGATGL